MLGAVVGCDSKSAVEERTPPGGSEANASTAKTAGSEANDLDKPLVEPFDAPPLVDIDKTAEWIDQPVLDAAELLRESQAKEKPLATVAEALALRNEDADTNAKILSVLGRLPGSDKDVNDSATFVHHAQMDVKSLNPILQSSGTESEAWSLSGFRIFTIDWELKNFPRKETVFSWQTSKDRMIDKIVLRDDLTWSDGKPITAHDVEFSFLAIMNPRIPVPAMRSGTDELRYVKAYDDRTIVFFHKAALATNSENMNFGILPKHVYEKSIGEDPTLTKSDYHERLEMNPVCGGPYKVASRVRNSNIVFERREDYYMHNGKQVRDKPYFKRIRFVVLADPNTALIALNKGELDDATLGPEQWTTQTADDDFYRLNTKIRGVEWTNAYIGWNAREPFFSDVRVRKAMSYALDHEEMINKLCYGLYEPGCGIFYPKAWMAPKTPLKPYQQDLDRAAALLDEAGWTDTDGDGVRDKMINGRLRRFEFSMLSSQSPLAISIGSLMRQNLDQIGVVCNVRPLEFAVLQDLTQNYKFEAMMGAWGTGSDPATTENLWKTGEPRNYVGYSNPEVDRLYEEGKREFDRDKRAAIYGKIDELIYADQPYTWLYFRSSFYGMSKDLRGYKFSPRGPYSYSPGYFSLWKPVEMQ
jgi:peptide/nickel transport system substrate-binding protein